MSMKLGGKIWEIQALGPGEIEQPKAEKLKGECVKSDFYKKQTTKKTQTGY
jgi:hypothetical protein